MYTTNETQLQEFYEAKSILIIGACGTIGKNLAKQILKYNPKKLRLFDSDDTALIELSDEVEEEDQDVLRFLVGNIRDKERLVRAFEDIDYVFHCAAFKHVAIGEYNPREVIHTNIIGTENVIDAAIRNNVRKVLFTSSDKAVNPINTMGASKLLGEKIIIAGNTIRGPRRCIFSAVRFGNVLGSRGSIIPRFKKRIERGMKLIVTDPDMTRFMMPVDDAVKLTLKSMAFAIGGEIFVLKMPTVVLKDLVELFVDYAWEKYGIKAKIQEVGSFPGEKDYEELMTGIEIPRAVELDDMYIVLPHIEELLGWYTKELLAQMGKIRTKAYDSRFTTSLAKNDLKEILKDISVFEKA